MLLSMDPKTLAILVAVLLFLVSLLVNLLQRRYHKKRIYRLLDKGNAQISFLNGLDTSLGKLESACTFEMAAARSPEQIAKSLHIARSQIKSSAGDLETSLRSFREYRRKEKAREKHKKHLERMREQRHKK